ncbi:MAG: ABC transporter ATP-binding protein [Bacilli bacterium]|jgi:putative ABC transport system ATP-binding protein|nr:ABC transporter ATP-binding protein [Bacilli bacterium]
MLSAKEISKIYGKQVALSNVSLDIDRGEFVAIMGPSGSGKSTLLNLMAGIDKPSNGQIKINNIDINNYKNKDLELYRQKQMGFIFQEYHILNSLNVYENIALPLVIQKISKQDINERITKVAAELDITLLLKKSPYQLSGGEKQRVAIARALVTKPLIIFADEPTGSLDSKNAHNLLKMLSYQNETNAITMMMVTHDPFSASFASKVIFIKDGKLYHTITRGDLSRKVFYDEVIKVTTLLGGDFDAD